MSVQEVHFSGNLFFFSFLGIKKWREGSKMENGKNGVWEKMGELDTFYCHPLFELNQTAYSTQTQLVPLKKYYSLRGRNANHAELWVAVIPTFFERVLFIEVFKYLQTRCILSASLYIICYEGLFLLVYILVSWGLWRFSLTSSSVMERCCGANLPTKNKKQGLLCVCVWTFWALSSSFDELQVS